ncbi:hypothetical protein [Azospirillum sp. sgz302134]
MGKSSPSTPPPPDPVATANAQLAMNKETAQETARLNRVNQYTPWGSTEWTQVAGSPAVTKRLWVDAAGNRYDAPPEAQPGGGGHWVRNGGENAGETWVPDQPSSVGGGWQDVEVSPATEGQWQQTVKLNPAEQAILDKQRGISAGLYGLAGDAVSRVRDTMGQGIDLSGLPDLTQDFSADRDKVQQALLARLTPYMDQRRQQLSAQLANQGITLGSEAWQAGQDDLGRQENDLNLAAVAQAGQEQQRLRQMALQTRQQGIQERSYLRNLPLQDIATLMGTGGSPSMPQFSNVTPVNVGSPDIMGATNTAYQGQLQNAQTQAQASAANTQAIGGTVGSLAMAAAMFF